MTHTRTLKNPGAILSDALRLVESNLSVVPIRPDGSKAPTVDWKVFQARRPTETELRRWLPSDTLCGLAVINGSVSGNLETLDFDAIGLLDEYLVLCAEQDLGELLDSLPIVETPSGGYHIYYRCEAPPPGNLKLARASNRQTRIETRGEGGYALIPPSGPQCHPARKPYTYLRGNLADVPTISVGERNVLVALARTFNEYIEPEAVRHGPPPARGDRPAGSLRPGEDYARRGDYEALLVRHGWRRMRGGGEKGLWQRPGKSGPGLSATSNYAGAGLFYIFSTNAAPFESDTAYSPFAVYALLETGGDFSEAARTLAGEGYGDPMPLRQGGNRATRGGGYEPPAPPEPPPPESSETPSEEDMGPPSEHHFTDLGNARRLVDRWGERMRFVHAWGRWLLWDGTRWALDETGAVHRMARETITALKDRADALQRSSETVNREKGDALGVWALRSESQNKLAAMVSLAENEPSVPVRVEDLDQRPMLLTALNGTVDLAEGRLKPHNRADLITKRVPVRFDADAACPLWEAFLSRILEGDAERIGFLQKAVGFALTGDTRRRWLIIMHGNKGRNGKSTFIDTVHAMLGDYALATPVETLMVRRNESSQTNDLARLRGARFVSAVESDEGQRLAEGLLKKMTGGDLMTARFLYQESFDFKPEFKLFLATNHAPRIQDTSDGLWDRIRLVPFDVRIPDAEVDEELPRKLLQELPGILAWAVRGCLRWQAEGLGLPASVKQATSAYRTEMDELGLFIDSCCTLIPRAATPASQLYHAYEQWCAENGVYCLKHNSFSRRLSDRGLGTEKRPGGIIYRLGIGLTVDIKESD